MRRYRIPITRGLTLAAFVVFMYALHINNTPAQCFAYAVILCAALLDRRLRHEHP